MEKQKLLKLSLWTLIAAVAVFIISYFFFHFVTDSGITFTWHEEAGKPFVTDLIANLGLLFLFSSLLSFMVAQIWYPNSK